MKWEKKEIKSLGILCRIFGLWKGSVTLTLGLKMEGIQRRALKVRHG